VGHKQVYGVKEEDNKVQVTHGEVLLKIGLSTFLLIEAWMLIPDSLILPVLWFDSFPTRNYHPVLTSQVLGTYSFAFTLLPELNC
jgi:hypothetical protein